MEAGREWMEKLLMRVGKQHIKNTMCLPALYNSTMSRSISASGCSTRSLGDCKYNCAFGHKVSLGKDEVKHATKVRVRTGRLVNRSERWMNLGACTHINETNKEFL